MTVQVLENVKKYAVRYNVGLMDCNSFEQFENIEFTNKKEALKYFNKMKRFEKSRQKNTVTEEEKEWGLGGLIVKKVFGLYKIEWCVEKIK